MFKRFKVLKNLKEEWRMKTPKDKWIFIYNIPAKLGEMTGTRVLTDLKVDWFSYMGLSTALVHFPTMIYTMWIHSKNGETLKGMQCISTVGILVSVGQKCCISM